MKFKRNIYIVIISIIIYFALTLCYEKFIQKDTFKYVYCLTKNVSRGDKVLESDLVKVKIYNNSIDKYLSVYTVGRYYKDDYIDGTIILNNMILNEEEYTKARVNKEIISLKLNSAEDAASYQIEKGSIINIFYSAKLSEIENIFNNINKSSIVSNNLDSGYVTLQLLEKVEILNCFDKYGNIAKKGNTVETILIEVGKEESIKINNLKNYGKFTVSIIK